MSKKIKKQKHIPDSIKTPIDSDMTYKDLKKAVVVRGMPFEEVIAGDFCKLNSWLHSNFNNPIKLKRLDKYDTWLEAELLSLGANDMIHPSLRLGYIGEKDNEENSINLKKLKKESKPKEKREKLVNGLFKGTKKALTFECASKGLNLEDTIKRVLDQFEDASSKSIKIWYKKALKDEELNKK